MSQDEVADSPASDDQNVISHGCDTNAVSETSSPTTKSPPSIPEKTGTQRPVNLRHLVPTPLANTQTSRASTATAASTPGVTTTRPSAMAGGPASANYVVPPRPKPGRKPATDNPASKRKAQNRESQRAFRARKAAKLNEMQAQVETTETKHREEINDILHELDMRERRLRELEGLLVKATEAEKKISQERDFWKDQAAQHRACLNMLESQLQKHNVPMLNSSDERAHVLFSTQGHNEQDSPPRQTNVPVNDGTSTNNLESGCGNCKPDGDCACVAELVEAPVGFIRTPPRTSSRSPVKTQDAVFAEREIDFTEQFASKRARQANRPSIAFITDTGEDGSKCGFCTDDSNCLCNDRSLQQLDLPQIAMSSPVNHRESNKSRTTIGPGSCLDCQTNPAQKAWCQRVAQLRGISDNGPPSPASSTGSMGKVLKTLEPRIEDPSASYAGKSSIGCSEAFKLFEGRFPMDSDRMDWIGNLRPLSQVQSDTTPPSARTYSALELDTAGVIATLGNTLQPIQPRPSDGDNALLVRMAQQRQTTTQSPRADSGSPLHISSRPMDVACFRPSLQS